MSAMDDNFSETSFSKVHSTKYANVKSRLFEKPKAFIKKEE